MQAPDPFVLPLKVGYRAGVRTANQWLSDYGDSHRNPANKALHWICVPVILWCLLGMWWVTPFPGAVQATLPAANWATVAVLTVCVYYAFLSLRLAIGVLPLLLLMLWSIDAVNHHAHAQLWMICAALFILAWIGQFIGHAIEGRRPSFFKDLQFLMIGPLWLLADAYRRLGIRY
jgi:uncharacterized membrane protein YGL010W